MTDYAANAGDSYPYSFEGPITFADGLSPTYDWDQYEPFSQSTGVVYLRSEVGIAQIRDGTSNTYFAGEKYLNPDDYADGLDGCDDGPMYRGHGCDVERWTVFDPTTTPPTVSTPMQDQAGYSIPAAGTPFFGSAHADRLQLCFLRRLDPLHQLLDRSRNPPPLGQPQRRPANRRKQVLVPESLRLPSRPPCAYTGEPP